MQSGLMKVSGCGLFVAFLVFAASLNAGDSAWRAVDLPSRPMDIAESGGVLWVSGADELISRSSDGGKTWSTQHAMKGGGILLDIGFTGDKFGYAAGTGGVLLVTNDGGTTWNRVKAPEQVIYEASFADERHGLVHARRAIYSTADGGVTWVPVRIDSGSEELKGFSTVGTVLALDEKHMAIVVSEGNSAVYHQKLLITKDAGTTWKVVDIPSTGLTQLTKRGSEYWFAGFEVIEKDKPGGGYGVPLLMRSADGEDWTHVARWSEKEFSVCNVQGCLYWDGAGVELPPANPVQYWAFSAEKVVTAKYAVAQATICSVATDLECAPVVRVSTMPPYVDSSAPVAKLTFPPALNAIPGQGLDCIFL